MKHRRNLVVVGSVALDTVRSPYGKIERGLGGSAVHFAAAARLFCPTHIVGVVGEDFDKRHFELLKKLGIDTSGIEVQPGKTFHWQGYYNQNLNEAITEKTELNVFGSFNPQLPAEYRKTNYLFLANIAPALQLSVLKQVRKPRWIASDTMNFWISSAKDALRDVLKSVDISLMNDAEIRQFTGEDMIVKAAKSVMKLGPSVVIIKRGEFGVWCFTPQGYFVLPAVLLDDVKDPTGAGDSFAGGFLGSLTQHPRLRLEHIQLAAVYGTLTASFNVQHFSMNRLATLTRKELAQRLKVYKRSCIRF